MRGSSAWGSFAVPSNALPLLTTCALPPPPLCLCLMQRMVVKVGGIVLGAYLVRRALPAVRDNIYHSETLRRVKHTVKKAEGSKRLVLNKS